MVAKKYIYILMFLLVLGFVTAQPPFTPAPQEEGMLEIAFPKIVVFPKETMVELHVHVFNQSGMLMLNDTTDCYIHIYNLLGNHIVDEQMEFDDNQIDFFYETNDSLITKNGEYTYIVWCNASFFVEQGIPNTIGGFVSNSILFNENGAQSGDTFTGIMIALVAAIALLTSIGYYNMKNPATKLLFWVGFLSFVFAMIEFLFMITAVYIHQAGNNLVTVLMVNTIVIWLVGFAVSFITLLIFALSAIDVSNENNDPKWAK